MEKLRKIIFVDPMPPAREFLATAVGVLMGIGGISFLSYMMGTSFLIAPFGASAVLIYGAKSSPLAQPRNFIGSHFISATIAIICCNLFPESWYLIPIVVTLAILCMVATNTVHPPGGATGLLCAMSHQTNFMFLLNPLCIGIAILFVTAVLASRLSNTHYPYKK